MQPGEQWIVKRYVSANTSVGAGTQVRRGLREAARLAALPQPWVWVASVTILGFLMRRYHLGNESLWFDEADIVWRARQPFDVLAQGFLEAGENGPLYTLILHYWLALLDAMPPVAGALHLLFGVSYEAPVRGLSAIFGTAAIPLMYLLARRVGGHWLGIAAAILLAINPFHIWHSQDAKMYTMLVMMALASTLLYMLALERGTPLLWAGYVVATWVMLTTHSMAGLVLLAQLVSTPSLLKNRKPPDGEEDAPVLPNRRHWWLGWGWAMLLILGPAFPIVWLRFAAIITDTVNVGWDAPASLTDIFGTMFVTFAVNRAPIPWEIIGALAMAALAFFGISNFEFRISNLPKFLRLRFKIPGLEHSFRNSKFEIRNGVLVLALWLLPISVFWLVTLKVPIFQARYMIMALPPYLILVALGLFVLRRIHPLLSAGAAGLLGVVTFVALTGVNYAPTVQKEDWRGAMVYVQDHIRLRDVMVVSPGYLKSAVEVYYKPGGPGLVPERPIRTVPSLETEGFGGRELDYALHEIATCNERAWLIISPPRQAKEDPQNLVLQWFQYNWHTFDTREFNGVTVYGISFNGQPDCWFPPPDYREPHTFENGMQFKGYIYEWRDNDDTPTQPDASFLPLTMYWNANRKLINDYVIRIRVKDPSGNVVVDEALGPLNGYWPTSQWPANTDIIDYRDLRLPGGLPTGDYTVSLQLYPQGQPDKPLKLEDGSTELVFKEPLKVVPWQP